MSSSLLSEFTVLRHEYYRAQRDTKAENEAKANLYVQEEMAKIDYEDGMKRQAREGIAWYKVFFPAGRDADSLCHALQRFFDQKYGDGSFKISRLKQSVGRDTSLGFSIDWKPSESAVVGHL